jgi:hypothetical protein
LLPPTGFPGIGEPDTSKKLGTPTVGVGVDAGTPKPPSFVPINKNGPPTPIASAGGNGGANSGGNTGPGGANSGGNTGPGGANAGASGGNNASSSGVNGGPSNNSNANSKRDGDEGAKPSGPGKAPLTGLGAPEPDKKTASAPPLSKLLGNKDFLITIECRNDAVTISPGGFAYRWTASNLKATDEAVVQAVTNLIARRQASVRPGEPPYRPILCFQVSTEGLRTYYHVYPLLAPLRVTMTRENLAE